jgi:hypothetical protein
MRCQLILSALAIAAVPSFTQAQSARAASETVYVKGSVTGEIPPPGADLRYVKGIVVRLTPVESVGTMTTIDTTTSTITTTVPTSATIPAKKPSLDKKIRHGAGEAAGDVSKVGKKAAHGVKEAASDVKKKVTGKP